MMINKSFRYVRKSWIGGNGTMYFGIPSKIVEELNVRQDDYLLVDVVDNLIVIKKHDPQFTKDELNKVQSYQPNTDEKSITFEESNKLNNEEFVNPLKDLDL